METIASVVLPFFAIVGFGYLAAHRGKVNTEGIAGLGYFVFYLALPCLIFESLSTRDLEEILSFDFISAYAVAGIITFCLAMVLGRFLFGSTLGEMAVQGQGASISNLGYMGVPLIVALMGEKALVPVVLAMLVDMFLIQAPAMALLEADKHKSADRLGVARKVLAGFLANPFVLSIIMGALVSASGLTLPAPVTNLTGLLGQTAGPVALFAMGAALAGRSLRSDMGVAVHLSILKLVVHPLLVLGSTSLVFGLDAFEIQVALLAAALPIAGNTFIVARNFGVFANQASTSILLSTLLAMVTFSMVVILVPSYGP